MRHCTSRRSRRAATSATLKQRFFELSDALKKLVDGQERRATSEPDERHLESGARLTAAQDVVEASRETLVQSRQVIGIGSLCQRKKICGFTVGEIEQTGWVLGDFGDNEVAKVRKEVTCNVRQVVALLCKVVDRAQARVRVAIDQRRSEGMQDRSIGDAEHARDTLGGEFVPVNTDPRENLIEKAHAVAHAACGFASDDGERGVFEGDMFLFQDELETSCNGLCAN